MIGLNRFCLYELPSIFIDGNSEQIFYVKCARISAQLPGTICLEGRSKRLKSTHYNSKNKTS